MTLFSRQGTIQFYSSKEKSDLSGVNEECVENVRVISKWKREKDWIPDHTPQSGI